MGKKHGKSINPTFDAEICGFSAAITGPPLRSLSSSSSSSSNSSSWPMAPASSLSWTRPNMTKKKRSLTTTFFAFFRMFRLTLETASIFRKDTVNPQKRPPYHFDLKSINPADQSDSACQVHSVPQTQRICVQPSERMVGTCRISPFGRCR